jgi:2Fe-2S type ferredoxin
MYDVVHGDDPAPPSNHRSGLPDGLDQVVLTALERDKRDRYDTVQEFKQALEAIRTGGRLPPIVARRLDERQPSRDSNTTTETAQSLSQSGTAESGTDKTAPASKDHSTDHLSERSESDETGTWQSLDRSTLLEVLGQVTDEGASSISGEELAAEFDAGRSEVYDVLDELKSASRVEYASGYGYKLVDDEDEADGKTKEGSPEKSAEETRHRNLQQDTLLAELESLSDGGATGVSGSDLADRFEADQSDVYDILDDLKTSGDIEYVSEEGYKPRTGDRESPERSRAVEESEPRGTQGTPDNPLDPERVRSTLAAVTDEGSKAVPGEQLASKFDASQGDVYDVLDDLKTNSEVEYVSGRGYTLTQRGRNQRTTPLDDRRQQQGSLADQTAVGEGAAVEFLDYEVVQERGWDPNDPAVFERATAADLPEEDHAVVDVGAGEYILEAAEAAGYDWPYSCRAGACTNCAAIVVEGEVDMAMQQVLTDEEVEKKDIRLTCVATPETERIKLLYNAKHLDCLQNRVI